MIYEEVFKMRLYRREKTIHNLGFIAFSLLGVTGVSFLFYQLRWYSFDAWNLTMLLIAIALIFIRKDLLRVGLLSGLTFLASLLPIYWLMSILSPGWIDAFWYTQNLSGTRLLGVPIEDYYFYFLVGFIVGPFYEYWQGERLRRLPLK